MPNERRSNRLKQQFTTPRRKEGPYTRRIKRHSGTDKSRNFEASQKAIEDHVRDPSKVDWNFNTLILGSDFFHVGLNRAILAGPASEDPIEVQAWIHDHGFEFLLASNSWTQVYWGTQNADDYMATQLVHDYRPLAIFIKYLWWVKKIASRIPGQKLANPNEAEWDLHMSMTLEKLRRAQQKATWQDTEMADQPGMDDVEYHEHKVEISPAWEEERTEHHYRYEYVEGGRIQIRLDDPEIIRTAHAARYGMVKTPGLAGTPYWGKAHWWRK